MSLLYLRELNIIYKGDKPKINESFKAESFVKEFAKINRDGK